MEYSIINQLSNVLKIAPEFVVREYWEMLLLKELSDSQISSSLIFKGGTALRLGYNSPSFSIDLDFDLTVNITLVNFKKTITNIVNKFPELTIKDLAEKFNTLIAQISIKEENLPKTFSIKIEISKRSLKKKGYFEYKLLTSPTSSQQVLINTAKLDNIKKEKEAALKQRRQARDLFDLWYIAQVKREVWVCPKHVISQAELKKELNKFLPKDYQKVIMQLLPD